MNALKGVVSSVIAVYGLMAVFAAEPQGALVGDVYTIRVPDGETWTLNDGDVVQLGTSVKLVLDKTSDGAAGTGLLDISRDLSAAGWDGEVEVKASKLRINCSGALGGTEKGTHILSGGQLINTVSGKSDKWVDGEEFEFEGVGPDGAGALVGTGTGELQWFLSGKESTSTVKLTGDATFTFAGTCDFRKHKAFDMGGHDLTVKGAAFSITATAVLNAGNIRVEANQFGVEQVSSIGMDESGEVKTLTFCKNSVQTFRFCATSLFPLDIVTASTLTINHGGWGPGDRTISGDVSLGGDLNCNFGGTDGAYSLTFTGKVTANGHEIWQLKPGVVTFSQEIESPSFSSFRVDRGELNVANVGLSNLNGTYQSYIGSTYFAEKPARLDIGGGAIAVPSSKPICIGRASAGGSSNAQRGILEVGGTVAMTNNFLVGYGSTTQTKTSGALYQRGGFLCEDSNQGRVGYYGDGYYEMTDGRLYPGSWFLIGSDSGRGVFVQKGGIVETASYDGFMVASGSYNAIGAQGHAYICGGTFNHNGALQICKAIWGKESEKCRNGYGVFTVDGTARYVNARNIEYVRMAFMSNSVAILNLNGGVMQTAGIKKVYRAKKEYGTSWSYPETLYDDNRAYVNFGGGTLRITSESAFFYNKDEYPAADYGSTTPDRVTIFEGGARFEGETCDFSLGVPLRKPEGNCVKSIPFSCDVPWRYIGSPMIKIIDTEGSGYGASALAEFDSESGTITGVKITSPGCNYVHPVAQISYGGWSNTVEVAAVVGAQARDGGVTVAGSRKITFNRANTYEGPTRIEGAATLLVGNDAAIPTGSEIVFNGGTLDMNGRAHTATSLSGTNGTFKGSITLTDSFVTDYAMRHGSVGSPITVDGKVTFADGAKVVFRNSTSLSDNEEKYVVLTATEGFENVPQLVTDGNEKARLYVRGTELKIGPAHGLMLLVR